MVTGDVGSDQQNHVVVVFKNEKRPQHKGTYMFYKVLYSVLDIPKDDCTVPMPGYYQYLGLQGLIVIWRLGHYAGNI